MNESNTNQTLAKIIEETKEAMKKANYTENSIKMYQNTGFSQITRYFNLHDQTTFSPKILDNFLCEKRNQYKTSKISCEFYRNIRKSVFLLNEYYETSEIIWRRITPEKTKQLTPVFRNYLDLFCEDKINLGILQNSTANYYRTVIRQFLFLLEAENQYDFSNVSFQITNEILTKLSIQYPSGSGNFIAAIRCFLKYLYENEMISEDLQKSIPEFHANRRIIRHGFTPKEIEQILSFPDTDTAMGKRDLAIFTLATQTGLRGVDIANLKFSSIKWKSLEMQLVQHKTNKVLTLPLEVTTINVLADYILNGRPESDMEYIFITHVKPYRVFQPRSLSAILVRYLKKHNLYNPNIPRRGMHSLRRSFGARLLHSEVPLDVISELLGHSSVNSTKPYIATDEKGLRSCGLTLNGIEVKDCNLL